MNRLQLIQGDCLKALPTLDTASVDMVFADPPFNVGVRYTDYADALAPAEYADWCAAWIAECFRVLKDTGTFYLMTITRHLADLYPVMQAHGEFINQVNWKNAAAVGSKRRFWNAYQPILIYGKTADYKFHPYAQTRPTPLKNRRWGGYTTAPRGQFLDTWDDIPFVYAGSITHPEALLQPGTRRKAHPAQMPVALAARATLFSTDPGDVVLDPFNGSGTTGVAAWQTERRYIGIEQAREYCDLTRTRWAQLERQPRLPELHAAPPPDSGVKQACLELA